MYDYFIDKYAREYNVPYALAEKMLLKESAGDPNAISPKGATGLMQLMPGTARDMGVTNILDPEQNIMGGVKYYSQMRDKYGPIGGLYAYNWGPKNYDSYLKGKKKPPKETLEYVDKLSFYANPEATNAPMDLRGTSGVFPQVLPVSNPTPQVPPQVTPQVETPKMDDYEQMKIFNPYVQMALGILAGNSGETKSQAFANAMGGGLKANLAGQEALDRARQTALQKKQVQIKQDEYERMRRGVEQTRKFATSMAAKGGPMADTWKGIAESEDPDTIIKMRELENRMQYNNLMGDYYTNKNNATSSKPNSYSLPTESDVKSANAILQNDTKFGKQYEELSSDQKKAIATQYATAAKRLTDLGDPDPWNNAKSIIGELPAAKQTGFGRVIQGGQEFLEGAGKTFKDILGW